jgi:hypothetical protein
MNIPAKIEINDNKIYIKINKYFNIDYFRESLEFADGLVTSKIIYQSFLPESEYWILFTKSMSVYIVSKKKIMFNYPQNTLLKDIPHIKFDNLNKINTLKTWINIL